MTKKEKKIMNPAHGKPDLETKGIRMENELELLKMILDENPDLKAKVLKFMKKNYSKLKSA
jgi:hypothetical protein